MAPFGKLYSFPGNPRTNAILVIAKANNLELDIVKTVPHEGNLPNDYLKLNPLGRIPTFQGADGFILTECVAIAIYIASQNEKTTLLGKTKQDYASILKWMSYANSECLPNMGGWFRPLLGRDPYNKRSVEDAKARAEKAVKVLEDHFLINTYLVGERITLADIFTASIMGRGFQFVFDKEFRKEFPNFTRWYETVANQSMYKDVVGEPILIEEAIKYQPPAKAAPPKKEKETPKPKSKDDDEEDEDLAPKEVKAKHPLEELGKSTFVLDDWKRKYKNDKDTRGSAMPWFWENVNFEEFSIWQFDFKFNDELTMTFMSANQIGGFFNRLEASRKYLMGGAGVYGVTNDSVIRGAFVCRGQDIHKAVDVAPDWESYDFKKLDPKNAEDKETLTSLFAGDKPVVINGKAYEYADGKDYV